MRTPEGPTFLCRAYAAYRLLSVGKAREAEDELAAGFGQVIQRIERDGKVLCKMVYPSDLTDEQMLRYLQGCQDAMKTAYPEHVPPEAHP